MIRLGSEYIEKEISVLVLLLPPMKWAIFREHKNARSELTMLAQRLRELRRSIHF